MKKNLTEKQKKYEEIYNELFEEYIDSGYYEDEADMMATREAGIKMGYGCPDLFW